MPVGKSLFVSKTFWFNALTLGAEITQAATGATVIPPAGLTIAAGAINIGLRLLTTQPVHVLPPEKK